MKHSASLRASTIPNHQNQNLLFKGRGYDDIGGLPVSRLSGGPRVGPNYFVNQMAICSYAEPPEGLVDDFSRYHYEVGSNFDLRQLDPRVRDFYEHTNRYELRVQAKWEKGFKFLSRIFGGFGLAINQMVFPLPGDLSFKELQGILLPLESAIDGRHKPRAWVRTYPGTKKALYVAAYAYQVKDGKPYVNVAFPVPGGNLTSVLGLETTTLSNNKDGLLLAALPDAPDPRDGVYFVNRLKHLRLPLHETIEVWSEEDSDTPLKALHKFWLGQKPVLTLNYDISFKKES